MGRSKTLGLLKSFIWYASQLSWANGLHVFNILSFVGAHHREWLQSEGCCMAGLLLFPVFPQELTSSHWRATVTDDYDILIYWYDRKYSASHMAIEFMWNHKKADSRWNKINGGYQRLRWGEKWEYRSNFQLQIKFWGSNVKHGDYSYYCILECFWE